MTTLKYKIGDKVILINGKIMTIDQINYISEWYRMSEDPWNCYTDEMIKGLVEEPKSKFKIGDKVIVSDTSGIWEITDMKNDILYSLKRENHAATLTIYGGFLTLYEGISDKTIEKTCGDKIMVTQKLKESLRKFSRKYAGIREDADLEEEIYFNSHKVAQMQAYEAGFKAALIALGGFIDASVKEL